MQKYDIIDFKIKNITYRWGKQNCCVLFINGKELLPIIQEKEVEFFKKANLDIDGAGNYHYLDPNDLYVYLRYADLTFGDTKAPILCCSCGEVGCASVKIEVARPVNVVIWKNFESLRKSWNFKLKFQFDPKQYEDFLVRLKKIE